MYNTGIVKGKGKRKMSKMGNIIFWVIIIVLILGLFFMVTLWIMGSMKTEVENYVVKMEIIEKDYSSYYAYRHGGDITNYIINARNEDDAFTKKVSEKFYSKYAVGDEIFVKIQITKNKLGVIEKTYEIVELENIKNINE